MIPLGKIKDLFCFLDTFWSDQYGENVAKKEMVDKRYSKGIKCGSGDSNAASNH